MSSLKKAWVYVTRKKSKSIVLLVIFSTILILLNTIYTMKDQVYSESEYSSQIVLEESQNKKEVLQKYADKMNEQALEKQNESMISLFDTMSWILIISGILILLILMVFRIRQRRYEIGIQISIGISKIDIIKQFFMESYFILIVSVLFSLLFSIALLIMIQSNFSILCYLKACLVGMLSISTSVLIASLSLMTKSAKNLLVQID